MSYRFSSASCLLAVALLIPMSGSSAAEVDPRALYSLLSSELLSNEAGGDCSLRADVWAYELWKKSGIKPAKAVIFYSKGFSVNSWRVHMAPALKLGRQWIVFEKANGITQPLELREWMAHINSGRQCAVLEKVPEVIRKAYRKRSRFQSRMYYDSMRVPDGCRAFLVDADFRSPENGFCGFLPNPTLAPPEPLRFDRALKSCVADPQGEFFRWVLNPLKYYAEQSALRERTRYCRSELGRF